MRKIFVLSALPIALGGCATLPNVTVSYYFPVMEIQYAITQSLTCDDDEKHLYTMAAVTAKTIPAPDVDAGIHTFSFQSVGGKTVDSDLAFNFNDDGRLLGINSSSTGEGGTIIKSVVGLAVAVAAVVPAAHGAPTAPASGTPTKSAAQIDQDKITAACSYVAQYGVLFKQSTGDNAAAAGAPASAPKATQKGGNTTAAGQTGKPTKVLVLTYSLSAKHIVQSPTLIEVVDDDGNGAGLDVLKHPVAIPPDPDSFEAYTKLSGLFKTMKFELTVVGGRDSNKKAFEAIELTPRANWAQTDSDSFVPLPLNRIVLAKFQIAGPNQSMSSDTTIWTQSFTLPERGEPNPIPVPIGKTFGKNSFSLSLGDDGSIQKISYTSASGMSDALDAATQIASAAKKQTPEQKAADIQGQADLIYQQQRLLVCQANPATCASK
ncbi:hypothetical protein [Burkholderia sp. L27(2015)]|uniref:hypothetical protein n=1 Tax=Burkholderia sp. L27(2015) TaxID=1641858 RepID=UPI00131A81ED|nr:hypothetical protein [Burkholderia sp. L27(2015)]